MRITNPSEHFDQCMIDDVRRRLEAERRRLLDLYQESVERELDIPTGEAEDRVDRAKEGWDKEEIFAERQGRRTELLLVEEALDRLAGASYGFCLYCGDPIDPERLLAVPATRYCAEHQEDAEDGTIERESPGYLAGVHDRKGDDGMKVLCAVCETEIDERDALILDQAEGEEPIVLCSEACLRELEENPELLTPPVVEVQEEP